MQEKTNYIIPHTHWDREWRYPLWKTRMLLVEFMDELLDTLERDPEYHCFLLDGQIAPVFDYLEVKPENTERLMKQIRSGRIAVGPWYTLPDLYPLDGECLVRNLLKGVRAAEKCGECLKVGYNSFGWGQTAQFPQLYKGFGIDFIICAKKVSKERAPQSEFFWEGPDGTRVLTSRLGENARANFYFMTYLYGKYGVNCLSSAFRYRPELSGTAVHNADASHMDEDFFMIQSAEGYHKENLHDGFLEAQLRTEDTAAKKDRLYLNGTDFSTPHPELTEMLHDLQLQFPDDRFVNTRLEAYAARMHELLDQAPLQTVYGELRDGPSCDCSGNALASRMYLKLLNKQAENLLLHQTEPLMVLHSLLGGKYEQGFLQRAWQYMLESHPHDSINGVTQDKTANDVENRLAQAVEMGQVLADHAAYGILRRLDLHDVSSDTSVLVVFNPHPYPISPICKVTVNTPVGEQVWNMTAFDCDGNILKTQDIFRDEKAFPVHDMQARPWPLLTDRHLLYLQTGEIPAMGYKTIFLKKNKSFDRSHYYWIEMRQSEGQDICVRDNVLENEYLRVCVNANGTIDLLEKESGRLYKGLHYFEDAGDVGNYWAYYPPYHNEIYTTLTQNAEVWCEDNGPLSATLGIRYKMMLPETGYESKCGIYGEGRRSEKRVPFEICSHITLEAGAKVLKVHTEIDNHVENHRLRVAFPTGICAQTVDTAGHFYVDKRPASPQKDTNGKFYPEMQTLPMQVFADVSDGETGLGIVNNCFTEYEMRSDNTLYLTLFRAMGNLIVTWWEAVGVFPDQKGSQLLRKMSFDYAIYPHKGNWQEGGVYEQARSFNTPPLTYQLIGGQAGTLPLQQSFFEIHDRSLQISAFKKAEDRDTIVLRVYNPTDDTLTTTAQLHVPDVSLREVYACNLNEVRQEALPVEHGQWTIQLSSNQIMTYELVTESSHVPF